MIFDNEKKFLLAIKTVPIIVILLVGAVATLYSIHKNRTSHQQQLQQLQSDLKQQQKAKVKQRVTQVHEMVKDEKSVTQRRLKNTIKSRVYEAHAILNNIYQQNKDKSQKRVKQIMKDALRDIRFNNGRGYYFIYEMDGTNVLLPPKPDLEGTDFWDLQDSKGGYTIRNMARITRQKGEGFYNWWWYKPGNDDIQHKKIGFCKKFEPFNWFIGTGEYVKDFEADVQKKVLEKINRRHNDDDDNAYVFVTDYKGTYLAHVKKQSIGKNRIELEDKNGFMITKEIINTAKSGSGFIEYIGTIKPDTGKPAYKTTFIQGYQPWNWAIGSGFYLDDLNQLIQTRSQQLREANQHEIKRIATFSLLVTLVIAVLSFITSKILQRMFYGYKSKVDMKQNELVKLNRKVEGINKNLQEQVEQKLQELRQKDQLLAQQSKMVTMGEMIGNIAHQWRQPLNALSINIQNLEDDYEEGLIDETFIDEFIDKQTKMINYMSKTIDDFRNFFKPSKTKRRFDLKESINEVLNIVSAQFKNKDIKLVIDIDSKDDCEFFGYENEFKQVIINILNNAKDAIISKQQEKELQQGLIKISLTHQAQSIKIVISDNAGGIKQDNLQKVFEPYFSTKDKKNGTGLGLYMSKAIIEENMNGALNVKNDEMGAVFTIVLPTKSGEDNH